MTTKTNATEIPIVIGEMGRPESITLTHLQARFLLGFLLDPDEVDQMIRNIQCDLGDTDELIEIAPTPVPQAMAPPTMPALNTLPFAERMEAVDRYGEEMAAYKASQQTTTPKVEPIAPQASAPQASAPQAAPTPAPEPTPSTTKPVRKSRKAKTAPTITIVDTLAPIVGISALPGKPLPSPTATCTVSRPSQTPNVATGTGVEKIASASLERETTNNRGDAELRQRAKELGLKCHKTKSISADTLRARIAIAEAKLAAKVNIPVAVAAPVKPIAVKTVRTVTDDFVNVLNDGRKLYTIVYSDGTVESEIGKAAVAA